MTQVWKTSPWVCVRLTRILKSLWVYNTLLTVNYFPSSLSLEFSILSHHPARAHVSMTTSVNFRFSLPDSSNQPAKFVSLFFVFSQFILYTTTSRHCIFFPLLFYPSHHLRILLNPVLINSFFLIYLYFNVPFFFFFYSGQFYTDRISATASFFRTPLSNTVARHITTDRKSTRDNGG